MISIGEIKQPQAQFDKYIGFGLFKVVAVNPSQMEYEELFKRHLENWKGYVSEDMNGITMARVTFILQQVIEKEDKPLFQATYFLKRQTRKTLDGLKTKVIDKYGNTAWVTDDEFKKQAVPKSKTGKPLSIIPPYRPCCDGEDKLISFIRAWRYVPNSFTWTGQEMVQKDNVLLSNCVVQLDKMKDYWEGDFKEIQDLLKNEAGQSHTVNALLTVKEGINNGMPTFSQGVYWKVTPGFSNTNQIVKEYTREQQRGMHSSERFAFEPMFKFTPDLPKQSATTDSCDPFAPSADEQATLDEKKKELEATVTQHLEANPIDDLPF